MIQLTAFEGLKVISPKILEDERGYFFETYNQRTLIDWGINDIFVQDNEALSNYGVIRGLHYQVGAYAQAKLVRVIMGEVLDVVVDIRPNSKTYGESFSIRLSEENKKQLYVPRGFAHGYAVLSERAIFAYKCDNFYHKASEGGILYNDLSLNIDWIIPEKNRIVSEKDRKQELFGNHLLFA